MKSLNIQVFVDVISLLSNGSIEQSVFINDDSPFGSRERGTYKTISAIIPGQSLQWTAIAIDVQTNVWIGGITFGPKCECQPMEGRSLCRGIQSDSTTTGIEEHHPEFEKCGAWTHDYTTVGEYNPWLYYWQGFAPAYMVPGLLYPYALHLRFGRSHKGKTIVIEGPKLALPYLANFADVVA